MKKTAFPPIVNNKSKVMILGTMPGEESLRKREYYGHKNNQFWRIIFGIYDLKVTDNYNDKVNFLLEKEIALWDVLHSCERSGSGDSQIKKEKINNFPLFFKKYPKIRCIFFDSRKAEELYKNKPDNSNIEYLTHYLLPSPSPANAHLTFKEKLEKWKIMKEILSKY